MATTAQQIEQAKAARTSLQALADRPGINFRLRLAYGGAATLLGTAIASASGAKDEIVAQGALAGGISPVAAQLKTFKLAHPEHADEIGEIPEQLAAIALYALDS